MAKMVVEGKAVRIVVVVIGIMKLRWLTIVRYDTVLAKKYSKIPSLFMIKGWN